MTAKTDQGKMTQVNFQKIPQSSALLSMSPVEGGKKWKQTNNKMKCEFIGRCNNGTPMLSVVALSGFEKSEWFKKLTQSNFSKPDQK